jgi:hypothetical protein
MPGVLFLSATAPIRADDVAVFDYHMVPARLFAKDLMAAWRRRNGKASLKTVEGDTLWAESKGNWLTVWDAKGNGGQDHDPEPVDTVLMPG